MSSRERSEKEEEKEITKKEARNLQMRPLQQQQVLKPGMTTPTALRLIVLKHSKRKTERETRDRLYVRQLDRIVEREER